MTKIHDGVNTSLDTATVLSRLKMRHLWVIRTVGRSGSLQKASEQLNLSQSAVSKTLAEAEALTGVQLFERTSLGSRPTLLGEILVRYSDKIVGDLRRAGEEFEAMQRGESGQLKVGIFTPMGWWSVIPQAVAAFQKRAPRVKLTLHQASMEELRELMEAETVDVIVGRTGESSRAGSLRVEPLYADGGPRFVARAGHPLLERQVALADLVSFPWLIPEPPNRIVTELQTALDAEGLAFPSRVIYSHAYTINLSISANTDMLASLPSFAIDEIGTAYGLREVQYDLPVSKRLPISALTRDDKPMEPPAALFLTILKQLSVDAHRANA